MAVPISKNDGRVRKDIQLRGVFYGRRIGQQVHVGIMGIFFYTLGIVKDTFLRSIRRAIFNGRDQFSYQFTA